MTSPEQTPSCPHYVFLQLQTSSLTNSQHLENLGMIQTLLDFRFIFDLLSPSNLTFLLPYSCFQLSQLIQGYL